MKVTITIFAVAAILATTVIMTTTIQQALADKVSPNCKPGAPQCKEDQLTQGGLGEFYSNEGKETYYGSDVGGQVFGDVRSDFASSDSELIGANTAYYGSGDCHSDREPKACR
jgi:hypothetical protein